MGSQAAQPRERQRQSGSPAAPSPWSGSWTHPAERRGAQRTDSEPSSPLGSPAQTFLPSHSPRQPPALQLPWKDRRQHRDPLRGRPHGDTAARSVVAAGIPLPSGYRDASRRGPWPEVTAFQGASPERMM
ncbi:PREDICTED: uncharacterized protein LOC105853315 [Condylura cristata]|uniref:uncharacterized protein LOC105853315 n=1 Tax=Condylura cristata TaxID=143302 RepID=UPI0006437797|nr:PREDICTED: uncharacterized protein LOC105853315 [Condylura cristata]